MKKGRSTVEQKKWSETKPHKNVFMKKFEEFCKRTDLHGYKYIVMQDLTLAERFCWLIAVLVSIICAVFFVITAYRWYAINPIVTVIESTHGPIWNIPFPAVTVCGVNIISRAAATKLSNELHLPENVTAKEIFETMRWAPLLHSTFKATSEQKAQLKLLQRVIEMNFIDIPTLFTKLSPAESCKHLLQRCMWKNTIYRCDLLFNHIYTQFSLCCTFNYYAVKYLDSANIEGEMFRPDTPRRVASCGYQTALTVLLYNNQDDYYSTAIASSGILAIIDNAYNMPDVGSPLRLVSPSTEMFIALNAERTYATSGIKAFAPHQRQCYFGDEVKLGIFQEYSYHNCLVERKAERIKQLCECLPFYYPTKESYRKCNFSDMDCLEKSQQRLGKYENYDSDNEIIECLPDCEHYEYPLEVAMGMLATDAPPDGLTFFKDISLKNKSLLNVFFNDLVSTRYRRDVFLNWQNLLASFGGLLSLMLGFTLISAIDLVIFFTFRMAFDMSAPSIQPNEEVHNKRQIDGKLFKNQVFAQKSLYKNNWLEDKDETRKNGHRY